MAKLINLIPNAHKPKINEALEDMEVALPSKVEKFLERLVQTIKSYNLPKKKEQAVIARVMDSMGVTTSELNQAVQKLKKYDIVKRQKTGNAEHDYMGEGLNEESFLDNFKKVNRGYDPKQIIANFTKQSGKDNADVEDRADHKRYVKDMTAWFDKMEKNGPTVKVGDLVKVSMRSNGKEGIGKIVAATKMAGNFGFMGQAAPDNQPAWKIDCYTEKNIGTTKKPIEYKGKSYYYMGTLQYPQHEEGNKNTFSKLK